MQPPTLPSPYRTSTGFHRPPILSGPQDHLAAIRAGLYVAPRGWTLSSPVLNSKHVVPLLALHPPNLADPQDHFVEANGQS